MMAGRGRNEGRRYDGGMNKGREMIDEGGMDGRMEGVRGDERNVEGRGGCIAGRGREGRKERS